MPSISARLDRLPISSLHRRLAIALAFAYFFDLSNLNLFGYAILGVIHEWHVSVTTVAWIVSAGFIGMFFGSVFGGTIADRFGRKRGLIIAIVIYTIFALATACSWNIASLVVFRILNGVGVSAVTIIANTYVGEVFPSRQRGRFLGLIVMVGVASLPVAAWIARFIVPMAPWGWRLMFIWGGAGLISLFFVARIPESPRWLHLFGKTEEAEAATLALENAAIAEHGPLPAPDSHLDEAQRSHVKYGELFSPAQRGRTAMLLVLWIFQTLGFYGFLAWVPTLLLKHGFSMVHSLIFSSVIAMASPIGAYVSSHLVERFDRKWVLIAMSVLIAIFGLLYGLTFEPAFIMIFGFLCGGCTQIFVVAIYTYTPELFPTHLRSSGHGLVYGVGRLVNVVGPFIISFLFNGYGYGSVFAYITACWIVVALVIFVFGPKTSGISLETVNKHAAPENVTV